MARPYTLVDRVNAFISFCLILYAIVRIWPSLTDMTGAADHFFGMLQALVSFLQGETNAGGTTPALPEGFFETALDVLWILYVTITIFWITENTIHGVLVHVGRMEIVSSYDVMRVYVRPLIASAIFGFSLVSPLIPYLAIAMLRNTWDGALFAVLSSAYVLTVMWTLQTDIPSFLLNLADFIAGRFILLLIVLYIMSLNLEFLDWLVRSVSTQAATVLDTQTPRGLSQIRFICLNLIFLTIFGVVYYYLMTAKRRFEEIFLAAPRVRAATLLDQISNIVVPNIRRFE